jgi:hypothetical protein
LQRRQAAKCTYAIAGQNIGKFVFVACQLRAFRLGMPEMDHTRGKYAVLPADAGVKKPGDNVGVFFSPAAVIGIEAVDTIEIGPPDGKIA